MAKKEKFGVLIEGKETVSKAAASAEKGLSGLTKTMGLAVAAGNIFVGVLTSIKDKFLEFIVSGREASLAMDGIENGFRRLADNSSLFLNELKKSTSGVVSELDLMRQANQALLLGIDQEALPDMFKGAAVIAQASGVDITFALNSITAGIGRQSRMLLDNLGIIVKAEEAYRNYSKEIGKSVSSLTQAERTTAFTEAAIKGLNERVERLGGELLPTAKTQIDEYTSSLDNLKEKLGGVIVPQEEILSVTTLMIQLIDTLIEKKEKEVFWLKNEESGFRKSMDAIKKYIEINNFLKDIQEERIETQTALGVGIRDNIEQLQGMTNAEREEYYAQRDLNEVKEEAYFKEKNMNEIIKRSIEIGKAKTEEQKKQIQTIIDLTKELENYKQEVKADNIITDDEIKKLQEKTRALEDAKSAVEGLTMAQKRHQELGGIYSSSATGGVKYGKKTYWESGHEFITQEYADAYAEKVKMESSTQ